MSRTLAHRPTWAYPATHPAWYAEHDHRDGPCDLPDLKVWSRLDRHARFNATSCVWWLDLATIPPTCGCAMCSGAVERRMDRRRDRHVAKLDLRRGVWRDDLDDELSRRLR